MTPSDFFFAAMSVPYAPGKGGWSGMDCWGFVEAYFLHVHGVKLNDRADITQSNPKSFNEGFEGRGDWVRLDTAQDGSVWIGKALMPDGQIINEGHCGIVHSGRAYHMQHPDGFKCDPINKRHLRLQGFWKPKCLT